MNIKTNKKSCPVCGEILKFNWWILCYRCYHKYMPKLPPVVVRDVALAGKMHAIDTPEKIDYLAKTGYLKEEVE